jgi:hypothetical protein
VSDGRNSVDGLFGLAPGEAGATTAPLPEAPVDRAWFDEPVCRNCGSALRTPFCAQCGQKAARRFEWRDIGKESWERLRVFELKSIRTVGRLVVAPGTVAREYVMGRRTTYMHPLSLLVVLVALLVLMLAANRYFSHYGFADRDVNRMAARVMAYANWSFSLGIVAIFLGSWSVFRRRLGYNAVEHAVLAVFVQAIILAAIILNMVPTLIWRDPAFVVAHRAASQHYLYLIKLAIVAVAYRQFFLLRLRSEWPRLMLACLVFVATSWLLLRAYAAVILWLVSRTA